MTFIVLAFENLYIIIITYIYNRENYKTSLLFMKFSRKVKIKIPFEISLSGKNINIIKNDRNEFEIIVFTCQIASSPEYI